MLRRFCRSANANVPIITSHSNRIHHSCIENRPEGGPAFGLGGAKDGAVVVTLTFTFCEFIPSRVTELGETVQVALAGAPQQARLTVCLNPGAGVTVTE
jgi:hypothetical protein